MKKVGIVGLGKMGISHFALLNAHPDVDLVAAADSNGFLTSALKKHTKTRMFKDYREMLDNTELDALLVATPTKFHFEITKDALERGLHVFVEKPFTLTIDEGKALVDLAREKGAVNQVGFHNHFVGTFAEVRRLVKAGAIGEPFHVAGEAYGQVVTKPQTATWRSKKSEGGGCLHDYASHVVDLMNWVVGPPARVLGAHLSSIFSEAVDDAVYATFDYGHGLSGQLTTNWSDTSYRKMTTRITVCGKKGKIVADRQEVQVFLSKGASFENYGEGWTIRYITDLQAPVWFYLRGEEYSSQIDTFVQNVKTGNTEGENTFASAYATDVVLDLIQKANETRS